MIGYKVVKKFGGKYYSCIAREKARVEYKVGKFAPPPPWLQKLNYHLVAFKTLREARCFRSSFFFSETFIIFRAELKDTTTRLRGFLLMNKLNSGVANRSPFKGWPNGTLMAKEIKLLKRVK